MAEKSVLTGIGRGLGCRCPNCGRGRLLQGYLTIRTPCEVCANDNGSYPSDDFPPYLTILVVGHLVVPLFVWTDSTWQLSVWLESVIWLPVTLALCLLLLPRMKGATVGLCWAKDLVRADATR